MNTSTAVKPDSNVIQFPAKQQPWMGLDDYLMDGCENLTIATVSGDSIGDLGEGDVITYEHGAEPRHGNYVLDQERHVSIYPSDAEVLGVIRHITKRVA